MSIADDQSVDIASNTVSKSCPLTDLGGKTDSALSISRRVSVLTFFRSVYSVAAAAAAVVPLL